MVMYGFGKSVNKTVRKLKYKVGNKSLICSWVKSQFTGTNGFQTKCIFWNKIES